MGNVIDKQPPSNIKKLKNKTNLKTMREGIEEEYSSPKQPKITISKLLSVESIGSLPAPGQSGPTSFTFSPIVNNKQYITFLSNSYSSSNESRLCGIQLNSSNQIECLVRETDILNNDNKIKKYYSNQDLNTNASHNISLEEKLRRERQRIQIPTNGISSYIWSYDGEMMLLPWKGNLYIGRNVMNHTPIHVECVYDKRYSVTEGGSAIDPQFSPDNSYISYVMKSDLYILSTSNHIIPKRLTYSPNPTVIHHGLADFLAQEEMDRYRGYWWHPSSTGIAFVKVDESPIPTYRISYQTDTTTSNNTDNKNGYEDHRYPFAGKANPIISLGYISIDTTITQHNWNDNVVWLQSPPEASEYLTRIYFLNDEKHSLIAQWQNRQQDLLVMVKYDIKKGSHTILLRETNEYWINLHHMFRSFVYNDKLSFVFASERTGYSHLYLYCVGDNEAKCLKALSSGEWIVESIVGIDLEHEYVYVTGTYDSPLERHLYALSLDGSSPIRLTSSIKGMHTFLMDANCNYIIDTHSDLDRPTCIQCHALKYKATEPFIETMFTIFDSNIEETISSTNHHYPPPQLVSFPTTDGSHTLHAALYIPDHNIYGPGPYPLISSVYGGPHVQRVSRSWSQTADMRAQRLRSLGYAVIKCDNRGSARRGLAFESIIKHKLGRYEVLDQVTAVRYLTIRGIANPNKVGIYGWSYGGYLSAMCLCKAPDVFHCAVAGAPVTSWENYDTHYTERYMSTPTLNPTGYTESSLYPHIPHLKGKLMILHGLIDENVHFRHTAKLVNHLIANKKQYDLVIFPDERHSPKRVRDRVYMEQRISDFFIRAFDGDCSLNSTTTSSGGARFLQGHL